MKLLLECRTFKNEKMKMLSNLVSEIGDVIAAGCDTFVTADLKYNHFEEAKYRGLNLIDAGHFETENPICGVLEGILREAFPEIPVFRARAHRDETQFL